MSESPIKLIKPYIEFEDIEQDFRKILDSGMLTKGQYVEDFRKLIADYTSTKHAFLTTSATTALWVCLKALDVKFGDEVIVSDFSFPATANVVEDLGAKVIFADVSMETFNMLPEDLEKKITHNTKAVIFVDALGNPAGIHKIKEICHSHNIPLIEDAACAIGSSENGEKCGSIADFTCFSFHPRKLLTTGEGGAITVSDEKWKNWLEVKLNHGGKGIKGIAMDFVDYGYNFRLPELASAMGVHQLKRLDDIVKRRLQIRKEYVNKLSSLGFYIQHVPGNVIHNVQSLVFRVPESIKRDELVAYLKTKNIESTIGTYALSATTYYQKKYNSVQPNSLTLEKTAITFPCYDGVDVERVCKEIKSFCD